jgi:hypothetical protein
VAVLDSQDQRRGPAIGPLGRPRLLPHVLVDLGASLEEQLHHLGPSLARGKEQRREPRRQGSSIIGARVDQRLHHVGMPFGRRPHHRGLTTPFLGVDFGAMLDKCFDRVEHAGARGGHQGRFAAAQGGVRIGPRFEQ